MPLMVLGMMAPAWMSHDYPVIKEYRGFDSTSLVYVYWVFIGALVLGVWVGTKNSPLMVVVAIVCTLLPGTAVSVKKILNARLDDSAPKAYLVTISNIYRGRYSSACEIRGMSHKNSLHRFDCGRGKIGSSLHVHKLLGRRVVIEVRDGYFGDLWVSGMRIPVSPRTE